MSAAKLKLCCVALTVLFLRIKIIRLIDGLAATPYSFETENRSDSTSTMRECPRCESCYEDEVVVCPDDQVNTKSTLPGTTLLNTRYRLEKRIGRGAMGQVYLARDENLKTRRVAIKTIRHDVLSDEDLQEGEAIARFERDTETAV